MAYTITSTKGTATIEGDIAAAFRAAIAMETDLQPSWGVTISGAEAGDYECRNGRIPVIGGAGTDDEEEGAVLLQVDDTLVIAWAQGTRTPFADAGLIPA
jgi:hypothetical protein